MVKKESQSKKENWDWKECGKNHHNHHSGGNAVYGIGMIGALFYFLQNASSFQEVMVGIFKSVFWPAFLLFKLLSYFQL